MFNIRTRFNYKRIREMTAKEIADFYTKAMKDNSTETGLDIDKEVINQFHKCLLQELKIYAKQKAEEACKEQINDCAEYLPKPVFDESDNIGLGLARGLIKSTPLASDNMKFE